MVGADVSGIVEVCGVGCVGRSCAGSLGAAGVVTAGCVGRSRFSIAAGVLGRSGVGVVTRFVALFCICARS